MNLHLIDPETLAQLRANAERYLKLRNTHLRPNDPHKPGQIAIVGCTDDGRVVLLRGKNADELIDRLPPISEPRDESSKENEA